MINQDEKFAVNMLERISEDETFLTRVCFSDEATFHGFRETEHTQCEICDSGDQKTPM